MQKVRGTSSSSAFLWLNNKGKMMVSYKGKFNMIFQDSDRME